MGSAFLDELKQRNVVRIAGIYAVSGWAVFQVVNSLFPALDLPRWTISVVALLFLAGFPVALFLAWFTEMTPDGVRFVPRDRRSFGIGRFGWIDWVVAFVVILLLGFSTVQLYKLRSQELGLPAPFQGVEDKSVAVLPFASFSEEKGDEFFADGLTEELIDTLVQAPELQVAGRTSSFYFKGRNEDLREIGRKLRVAHVVEGSVRRDGARLRVAAQLIKVSDGFHIWSQSYDRTMDDAIAIQSELADAVAEKLKAELIGAVLAGAAMRKPEAYNLEIVARARLRTQELENLRVARTLYEQLLKIEPENPRAYAGLAQATILLAQNFLAIDFETARRESTAAVAKAIQLDPKSADAWRARGVVERVLMIRVGDGSHASQALEAFQRALALDPKDPEIKTLLANQYVSQGENERALGLLNDALSSDPLSRTAQHLLATVLSSTGRLDEARSVFEKVLALFPDYTSGRTSFAKMLMFQQGKLDEAVILLDDAKLAKDDPLAAVLLASCYANLGMADGVRQAVAYVPPDSPAGPIAQAILLQTSNRREELLAFGIQKYRETRDPIWQSLLVAERVLLGDYGGARALLPSQIPGLFKDVPDVPGIKDLDLAIAATVLIRTGSPERAQAALNRVLSEPPKQAGAYESGAEALAQRGYAFAAAGRTEEAVTAFEQAAAAGWRMPIEFNYFARGDSYPFMTSVNRNARYRRLMAGIESDLAKMRKRLELQNRAPALNSV